MNCENKCDCEVGADICDPVSGCICLPGWKGTHCEQDNDECNTEYSPCTGTSILEKIKFVKIFSPSGNV